MISMYIGSGDVRALLSGEETRAHRKLLQRFVSDEIPHYDALASPLEALRTGAILEERYLLTLPDGYYGQYKVIAKEMDVFKASIDFALLDKGEVVDFDELKTCNFDDFLSFEPLKDADYNTYINYIKQNYKENYNQIQQQLYCTGLNEANLVFLAVYEYDDEVNKSRIIKGNEVIKFRIKRDEQAISLIKQRGEIFQQIKNFYTK